MKATGIVRRIDDLGRVVIPKEIRRTLRIKEGAPLEIFTDREGEIILKKYSPIGELGAFSKEYAEALAQASGHAICITDRDQVIAAAGGMKKDNIGKPISRELEQVIHGREQVLSAGDDQKFVRVTEGDAIGSVVLRGKDPKHRLGETEQILARCAAGFMGRQMEQ